MKLRTAALCAALAASASVAGAVFAPLPAYSEGPGPQGPNLEPGKPSATTAAADPSRFETGSTVHLDARLGHATLGKDTTGDTYLFASVSGADAKASPPLNLAVVVDRSGSMKGERMARAIDAGVGIVQRMRDEDTLTVVSFDTVASVVVSPTRLGAGNRASIESAIRGIRIGGDTCISCGLEAAAAQLRSVPAASEQVTRMIVLSDGATNHGVVDLPGLRAIAGRMRDRGCSISTIGVDVDFDEKVMATLATESNGRHYFVASAAGLPAIFSQEFDSLVASIAQDAEMTVELAPGVEALQVLDRSFRRENAGGVERVIIPFGVLGAKQEKTALLKLRVPTDHDGDAPVAKVSLAYRDLLARTDRREDGQLGLLVKSDGTAQTELDPFVAARLERSRTAQTLTTVNTLFKEGHFAEAKEKLAVRESELRTAERRPMASAKAGDVSRLEADFDKQVAAVDEAATNFAGPTAAPIAGGGGISGTGAAAPPAHAAQVQVKRNQQNATDLGL